MSDTLLTSMDIRFTKVSSGTGRYEGMVYVGGQHYGYVYQQEDGREYVAMTALNERIGEAVDLRALREVVERHATGA